jgi:HSP20 family protein
MIRSTHRDRRNGAHPLETLKRFDDALSKFFFQGLPNAVRQSAAGWGLNLKETEGDFHVSLDAPGFEVDEFDIQAADGLVTVTAEHLVKEGEEERTERSLRRQFAVPELADAERIEAKYRNGVLTLRLPKVEQAQPRKIVVKGE